MTKKCALILLFSIFLLVFQSGCGLLIGQVKPVDEKSEVYGVTDLSKDSPDWVKLDQKDGKDQKDGNAKAKGQPQSQPKGQPKNQDDDSTEIPDVVFQSRKTASIISLNSACRTVVPGEEKTLQELTALLLLGIVDIELREEKNGTIQNTPVLQTTVKGKLNEEVMMLRTVVLQRKGCVYDLMYISRPAHFLENEDVFSRFVSSLKLKDKVN